MATLKDCIDRLRGNFGGSAKFTMNVATKHETRTLDEWFQWADERADGPDSFGIEFRQKNTFVWMDGQDRRVDVAKAAENCVMFNADLDPSPSIAARNPVMTWKPGVQASPTPTAIPKLAAAFQGNEKCHLERRELASLLSTIVVFGMGRPVLRTGDCVIRKLYAAVDSQADAHLTSDEVRQLIQAMAAFGAVVLGKPQSDG